jgi:hypothetical protein
MTFRIFLFFALFYTLVTSREQPWADAHVTYDTTQALVDRGAFDIYTIGGSATFYTFHDGKKYGVFPVGNVVAMIPGYLAYKAFKKIVPSALDRPLFNFTSHLSPSLMGAAACALFFMICRRRGASERWSLLLALAFGLGTTQLVYARSPYAEAAQTVALVWLIERTLAQAEAPTTAGLGWWAAAAGILINTKLVYALTLPPAALYLVWAHRRALGPLLKRSWLAVIVFAELMLVMMLHNRIKTGSLLDSGYSYKEGMFTGDLLPALYGFYLSTGKSVFLYSPPIILGALGLRTAWRERRAETLMLLSIIGVMTVINAKFRFWHADYCWGPRYLTPVQPLMLVFALPWLPRAIAEGRQWLRRCALGFVIGAGLVVQFLGAAFYWDHYLRALIAVKDQTGASGWFTDNLTHGHYIPEFSPIRGHLWMLSHLIRQDPDLWRDAPWRPVMPLPSDQADVWHRMRPDLWVIDWREPSPWAGAALMFTLAGSTAYAALSLRKKLREAS